MRCRRRFVSSLARSVLPRSRSSSRHSPRVRGPTSQVDEPALVSVVGVVSCFSFAAALSCGLQRYLGAAFFFLSAMSCARPRSVTAGAAMEPETVALSPLQVLYAKYLNAARCFSGFAERWRAAHSAPRQELYVPRRELALCNRGWEASRLRVRSHGSAAHCSSSLHRKRRIKNRT